MEGQRKHGNGFLWLLILVLVGVCGYFAYELYMKPELKEKNQTEEKINKEEQKKEKIEELDINDSLVKELTDLISINSVYGRSYYDKFIVNQEVAAKSLDNQFRLYLAYLKVPTTSIKKTPCSEDMQVDLEYGYTCGNGDGNGMTNVIAGSDMELATEKIFGANAYLAESFNPNYWMITEKYYYDRVHDNYVLANIEGGGTGKVNDFTITKAIKNDDTVIIFMEHMVLNIGNSNETLYSYEFSFKQEKENYIFYSVKRTQ